MDIHSLKLKYVSVYSDLINLQKLENEINVSIARLPQNQAHLKLNELENIQRTTHSVKTDLQALRQNLVARGVSSGEISLLETRAKQEAAVKTTLQVSQLPPPPSSIGLEQKLIQAIENEKFHDKHIKEVEEWNKQEKERQRVLLEQQQKIVELQKEVERKRVEDERLLSQQREEMQKKEEFLQQKEKQLTEQEKVKLAAIDNELRFIENEKRLLEAQRLQLDPLKQQKQRDLESERANLLGIPSHSSNSSAPHFPSPPPIGGFPPNNNTNSNSASMHFNQPNLSSMNNNNNLSMQYNSPSTVNPNHGSISPPNLSMHYTPPMNVSPNNYSSNLQMQINPSSNINHQFASNQPFFPNSPVPPMAPNGGFPQINPQLQQQFQQSVDMQSQPMWPQPPQNSQTELEKQWLEQQKSLQAQHSFNLQQMQLNHAKTLQEKEDEMRKQWDSQYSVQRNNLNQQLSDDVLKRMSELELKNFMDNANMGGFLEEFLLRRQKLLDEEFWLKQQDMINKQMALSFKEDDLRTKEMLLQQQKEAEMRAKNRVFSVFVEKTGPDGRKTGEVLKLQVRAGDSIFRICERIGYDKELFQLKLQYNGMTLEDPDRSIMDYGIPDNAVFVTKLVPSISVDIMNLIPCEDCGKAFDAEVFAAHKCMKGYSQELPKDRMRKQGASPSSYTTTTTVKRQVKMTACKYCNGLFPSESINSHLSNCSKRPRVYYYN